MRSHNIADYQSIYHAAKNGSEETLVQKLQAGCSISVIQATCLTLAIQNTSQPRLFLIPPVTQLAFEGHDTAVDLLLKHGANPADAVRGYALGRHHEKVTDFIKDGIYEDQATFGYAIIGEVERVNQLLDYHHADSAWALYGYAYGNHMDQLNKLLYKRNNPGDINEILFYFALNNEEELITEKLLSLAEDQIKGALYSIIQGFAASGREDVVNAYYDKYPALSKYPAICGFAWAGYIDQAARLLAANANDEEMKNAAILGYGLAGNYLQVNALLNAGGSINSATIASAINGHHQLVKSLLKQGANPDAAAYGYANNGSHSKEINHFIKKYQYHKQLDRRKKMLFGMMLAAIFLTPASLVVTLIIWGIVTHNEPIKKITLTKDQEKEIREKRKNFDATNKKIVNKYKPKKVLLQKENNHTVYLVDKAQFNRIKFFQRHDLVYLNSQKRQTQKQITENKIESQRINAKIFTPLKKII